MKNGPPLYAPACGPHQKGTVSGMALSIHEMDVDGKPVTWRYVAGVVLEAIGLLAFGWLMLAGFSALDTVVRGVR